MKTLADGQPGAGTAAARRNILNSYVLAQDFTEVKPIAPVNNRYTLGRESGAKLSGIEIALDCSSCDRVTTITRLLVYGPPATVEENDHTATG